MQDIGISFRGRISEITFAANVSCLAKERCILSVAHFEITSQHFLEEKKENFANFLYCMKNITFSAFGTLYGRISNFLQYRPIHLTIP
jgi:hypothetical protein